MKLINYVLYPVGLVVGVILFIMLAQLTCNVLRKESFISLKSFGPIAFLSVAILWLVDIPSLRYVAIAIMASISFGGLAAVRTWLLVRRACFGLVVLYIFYKASSTFVLNMIYLPQKYFWLPFLFLSAILLVLAAVLYWWFRYYLLEEPLVKDKVAVLFQWSKRLFSGTFGSLGAKEEKKEIIET